MAIFGGKKEKKEKDIKKDDKNETQDVKTPEKRSHNLGLSFVEDAIKHPRITEKATDVSEDHNVYTFDVKKDATKQEIAKAVEKIYKVKPVKVRTVRIPRQPVRVRGIKDAFRPGGKKAYVYLKEGDSIEFV